MGQSVSASSTTSPILNSSQPSLAQCPVQHSTSSSRELQPTAECPVSHQSSSSSILNPLNQIPTLSQQPAPSQSAILPTERESSSIPRDTSSTWDYPSPQQFYNALVRKGWETPEEHVEMMVGIHNFLNEQAWGEVLKWEKRCNPSLDGVELARFRGRPGELSPKARIWLLAGWLLPSHFNSEPPFDRHDWIVRRRSTGEEVRYVIDYYSAPPEPDGSPVFSLDVRPALDSVGSVKERVAVATAEVWDALKTRERKEEPR